MIKSVIQGAALPYILYFAVNMQPAYALTVFSGGNILVNLTEDQPAFDAKVCFEQRGFREKILGGILSFFTAASSNTPVSPLLQTVIKPEDLVRPNLFCRDIFFINDQDELISVPPNKVVRLDALIEARKENEIRWIADQNYLTDRQGNKIPSKLALGGMLVQSSPSSNIGSLLSTQSNSKPPVIYNFYNDGNVEQLITEIVLGSSGTFIDPDSFSIGLLEDTTYFNNGGMGWLLAPGESISLVFDLNLDFLIAQISGIADPNGEPFEVVYLQQHEEPIPEPTSTLGLLSLGILGASATIKRQVKRNHSIEKETTEIG